MPHSRHRYLKSILLEKLKFSPVVAIQGARQTGKSFTARELLKTDCPKSAYVTLDRPSDRELAKNAPESFLENYADHVPIIIDEAQKVPELFDAVKFIVDKDKRPGQFLLLGSTEFSKKTLILESLTGRISTAKMMPFTCAEALQLPLKKSDSCFSVLPLPRCERKDLMRHLQRGGMPGIFSIHSERERIGKLKEWLELTVYRDLTLIPKVKIDTDLAMAILREIARLDEPTAGNIAKKLKRDLRRIQTHLNCFELLFVIHKLSPIDESSGKPMYFLLDVAFAHYLEADFARCLHTWLVQETLANKEWSENIRETIGYYRSAKGAMTHLIIKHSRTRWDAVKIIANEKFSAKDLWSLTRLREKLPAEVTLSLLALTSTSADLEGVKCKPWESIV